ncbi:hypothetical protein WJX64_11160 [Leifsonia sp. YIM 134122]|uniref:Uncharacterized protein n=1 Tax=Leifsonia stereocauli TaxID=3134136 RepID=A0ABU9W537_9MICO
MAADDGVHGDEGDAVRGEGLDPRFDPRFQRGYSAPSPVGAAAAAEPRPDDKRPAGIDPRFDPRFQRGYDPERHQQVRRPIAADEVDDRPAFASTVKAGIPRPLDTPASRPAARTPVQPAATSAGVGATSTARGSAGPAAAPVPEPDADADADADDRMPAAAGAGSVASVGRNPFLLALWISCVALVVVGVVVIVQTATTTSGGGFGVSAFGDAFVVAAWVIAPPAVTVGLIGLVALTLSRALGWLADHPDRGDPGTDATLYDADDLP